MTPHYSPDPQLYPNLLYLKGAHKSNFGLHCSICSLLKFPGIGCYHHLQCFRTDLLVLEVFSQSRAAISTTYLNMNAIPCAMAQSHPTDKSFREVWATWSQPAVLSMAGLTQGWPGIHCHNPNRCVLRVCASLSNKDGNSKVVCLKILCFDGSGSTKLFFERKCFSESLSHSHLQASLAGGQTGTAGSAWPAHSPQAVQSPWDSVQSTAPARPSPPTYICEQALMLGLVGAQQPHLSISWRSHRPSADTWPRWWHLHHVIGTCPSTWGFRKRGLWPLVIHLAHNSPPGT